MITEEDLEYHYSDTDDYTWAETYYIPISLPDDRLFGHVYVCTRPVLGSMSTDVRFHGCVSDTEFELLHCAADFQLPAPERFSHIHGPNGLDIWAIKPPRDYRIDYVGFDGTEIHVDIRGIMHPWDIHDRNLNPLAGATPQEQLARTSMGSGYKGHFDMHCRTTGTVKLRGKEYKVDVVDRMNHSWGPRPERYVPHMGSFWCCFGEELGVRVHMHLDPHKPTGQDLKMAHGYLLDHGEVYALVDAKVRATRLGVVPISVEAVVTDQRGKEFRLRGIPVAGGPWRAYSNSVCWVGLFEWEHNGRIGNGSFQENRAITVENAIRGRFYEDRVPYLTS